MINQAAVCHRFDCYEQIDLEMIIERELPGINAFIDAEVDKLNGMVRDVARHIIGSGGKRIRPLLTLLFARALGYRGDNYHAIASSLEILHAATLLHDDILDKAQLRRGKTCAHLVFGSTETILAGDALFALANKLAADYGNPRLSWLLAEGIMETADGEIAEIEFARQPSLDRRKYMQIITAKSARLIECACRCGAALAGANSRLEDAAGQYGLNIGIAFQLVDDALDYSASATLAGKLPGGDLMAGKVTLPLILLLESMKPSAREALLQSLKTASLTAEQGQTIQRLVNERGYAHKTREEAARYADNAKSCLSNLTPSEEVDILGQIADFVLFRNG